MSDTVKYNAQNPKDLFLAQKLFRYLLNTITEQEDLEEKRKLIARIANMPIFPYIGSDGEKYLGNLTEANIAWFYLGNADRNSGQRSSKNYRIFAADVLPMDVYLDVISTFGPGPNQEGYIRQFSNDVVINALLDEMALINDYTDVWWQAATDIYRLRTERVNDIGYMRASSSINQDYFLFDPNYCDDTHRDVLVQLGVYRDIMSHPGAQRFMAGIPQYDVENAQRFLAGLGIPDRFTVNGTIDHYLPKLFYDVEKTVIFPCDPTVERDIQLCEISYYVVFSAIRYADRTAFMLLTTSPQYQSGITVPNMAGSYISLNHSLFYGNLREANGNVRQMPEQLRRLENLHLAENPGATPYRAMLYGGNGAQNYAISFEQATRAFAEYHLGNIRASEMDFYQWLWLYSHNQEIIDHVFAHLSTFRATYIDEQYNLLVLDMLEEAQFNTRQNYHFRMKFSADEALRHHNVLNHLARNEYLQSILPVVTDSLRRVDTVQMRYEILNNLTCDEEARQLIDRADFWNRIYVFPDDTEKTSAYVRVGYYTDGSYEPERIILIASEPGKETAQLINLIIEEYPDVKIESVAVTRRNWAHDYRDLMYGIRGFISKVIDQPIETSRDGQTIELDDMSSVKTELQLWEQLRLSRDAVLSMNSNSNTRPDIHAFGWSNFLQEKYHNRCQICGEIIPTNGTEVSYRFRIHSNPTNGFSDIASNIFCLCPGCRGDMQYGLRRRDMSPVRNLANQYISRLMAAIDRRANDEAESVISQLASKGNFEDAFVNPIVCPICINGKQEQIYFSWEHFLRLAFMFYDDDKDYTYDGEIGNLMQLLRMLSASE